MVSVIIVNFNTTNHVIELVASLHKYEKNIEIICVDNNSEKVELDLLRSLTNIIVVENHINVGFGRACNQAATIAKGEFLWFLNPDVIIAEPIFEKMSRVLSNNPKIGVIGTQLKSLDGQNIKCFGSFSKYLKIPKGVKVFPNFGSNILLVDIVVGANMLIRSELFSQFTGFDPNIFLYDEEAEIQWRLRKSGYYSLILLDSFAYHKKGVSSSDLIQRICIQKSLGTVIRTHGTAYGYFLFRFESILVALYGLRRFYNIRDEIKYLSYTLKNSYVK
jgi:GT2 family glycosyltransferase